MEQPEPRQQECLWYEETGEGGGGRELKTGLRPASIYEDMHSVFRPLLHRLHHGGGRRRVVCEAVALPCQASPTLLESTLAAARQFGVGSVGPGHLGRLGGPGASHEYSGNSGSRAM
jgi:hypothetical protein